MALVRRTSKNLSKLVQDGINYFRSQFIHNFKWYRANLQRLFSIETLKVLLPDHTL